MPGARVSGLAIAEGIAGAVLLWSGISNSTIQATAKGFLSGSPPALASSAETTGTPTVGVNEATPAADPAAGTPGTVTAATDQTPSTAASSSIATDALEYVGHCYLYGGAARRGNGCWDCSSFVNWVLCHDLGMAIPGQAGGTYNGSSHGPNTLSYLAWTGATTVGHSASEAAAGDLCVWQTHMGIALGSSQMVSALNPSDGTQVTSISGGAPVGELLYVRRVK